MYSFVLSNSFPHFSIAGGAMSEVHIGNSSPATASNSGESPELTGGSPVPPLASQAPVPPLGTNTELFLDNSAELDEDGWALIAPYGEHPKTRVYTEGGRVKEQNLFRCSITNPPTR